MLLHFWKTGVLFAFCSSVILAEEMCGVSEEKDLTSLVQFQQTVRRSIGHSDRISDEKDFGKDAAEIAEAKMLYKKILIDRNMATQVFEEVKAWAHGKIAEGKADLEEVKKLEETISKAIEEREETAKGRWKGALSYMTGFEASTKAATASKSKSVPSHEADLFKAVTKSEKYAQAVLLEKLKTDADSLIKKHIAIRKKFEEKATSDAANYTVAYKQALEQAAVAHRKVSELEANSETQAEEDVIMKNAQSSSQKGHAKASAKEHAKGDAKASAKGDARGDAKGDAKAHAKGDAKAHAIGKAKEDAKGGAKGHGKEDAKEDAKGVAQVGAKGHAKGHATGHKSFIQFAVRAAPEEQLSLDLDLDDIIEAADALKRRGLGDNHTHLGPEYLVLRSAIETSLKAEPNNTMEDVAKIADGTRVLLYGNISEYAVRLAAAKMGYKQALIETAMSANELKWYKDWGQDKITNGNTTLEKVEVVERAKAESVQLKLNQAKASWESMSAKMLTLSHAKDGEELKAAAEKKAEQSMNGQLAKQVQQAIEKKVLAMSAAAHAYQKNETKGDHATEKGYASDKTAADFKALVAKVDAELASQEKTIVKKLTQSKKKL